MAFFYDRLARESVDKARGYRVASGGSGGPHDPKRQSFLLIHDDWELRKIVYVYENGVHTTWSNQKDDRGFLITTVTLDDDAKAVIQFSGGEFVRGEVEWNESLDQILKQGIYCQYTAEGKEAVPVHFTIPDGSDLSQPFDPKMSSG